MFLKEFFYLPSSDRRTIITLLVLIVLVGAAIYAFNFVGMEASAPDTISNAAPARSIGKDGSKAKEDTYAADQRHTELFYFDPNTADSTQLLRLGLQPWQVRNIYKYRAKGGIYRSKEDFAFVYGLTVKEYRRLSPYIRISADYLPASSLAEVRQRRHDNYSKSQQSCDGNEGTSTQGDATSHTAYTPKISKGEYVTVNTADTTALKTIPGIGSYFARQTVRYRDQLGGFVSKAQLLEIENFPEEAMQYISIDSENIKKLNVNKMTLAQLRRHPYINYYQARAITDYRRLHGAIADIKELKLMKEFTEFDLNRIAPYLQY